MGVHACVCTRGCACVSRFEGERGWSEGGAGRLSALDGNRGFTFRDVHLTRCATCMDAMTEAAVKAAAAAVDAAVAADVPAEGLTTVTDLGPVLVPSMPVHTAAPAAEPPSCAPSAPPRPDRPHTDQHIQWPPPPPPPPTQPPAPLAPPPPPLSPPGCNGECNGETAHAVAAQGAAASACCTRRGACVPGLSVPLMSVGVNATPACAALTSAAALLAEADDFLQHRVAPLSPPAAVAIAPTAAPTTAPLPTALHVAEAAVRPAGWVASAAVHVVPAAEAPLQQRKPVPRQPRPPQPREPMQRPFQPELQRLY